MTRKKSSVVNHCQAGKPTAVSRNPALARQSAQAGNTLVWLLVIPGGVGLAVVLIWLALGVLERSRINTVIESLNGTAAAVFAYQDRYGRTPGDDGPAASLAARGTSWSTVTPGDVDGRLDIGINQLFTGNGESGPFWQQLRASGFWSGDPAVSGQAALPRNPWGGLMSALADEMGGGLAGNKICTSQVPGAAALAIDRQLDDGDGATGRLRATPGSQGANTNPSNAPPSTPYREDVDYTICYRM